MAERTAAVEIARTVNGQTDSASHLMRVGAGLTLCGIRIRPPVLRGKDRTWYPVAQDEADRFGSCGMCEVRSSSYYVVSRIERSERPAAGEAERVIMPPAAYHITSSVCQAIYAVLEDTVVMPFSTLREIEIKADEISDLAFGSGPGGLGGRYSALDGAKAFDIIRERVSEIRDLIRRHKPQNDATAVEIIETPENT